MDQVDTLHVSRYCSQVFFAVPSWPSLGDLEVKVTDIEICVKDLVKFFLSMYVLNM